MRLPRITTRARSALLKLMAARPRPLALQRQPHLQAVVDGNRHGSQGRRTVRLSRQAGQAAARGQINLLHRYRDAQVLQFKGPTGYWVRIRVPQDDKNKTREVYEHARVDEGGVFMVRLD